MISTRGREYLARQSLALQNLRIVLHAMRARKRLANWCGGNIGLLTLPGDPPRRSETKTSGADGIGRARHLVADARLPKLPALELYDALRRSKAARLPRPAVDGL